MTTEGGNSGDLLTRARAWRDADPDPATRAELDARIEQGDVRDCFEPPLGFGTAGLRGLKGPGPAHMNHRLIQRVTAVLADLLRAEVPDAAERGVVIGYDARHGSAELAETAAQTIAGAGLGVHVFDTYAPTPLVAFAALELNATAGLVLTASHNPPEYLGYKVYGARAVQIVPPTDERIAQALGALPAGVEIPQLDAEAAAASDRCPYWRMHGDELRSTYRAAIARPSSTETPLRVAYSAMHGVAGDLVRDVLAQQGGIELVEVDEQAAPDGDFPTVRFPNPEEPGALDRLTARAAEVGADLALATDPDGDRLAVALADEQGEWQVLMGDQTGVLIADALMDQAVNGGEDNDQPAHSRPFVMNTVVSSRLLGRVADYYGVDCEQTLTGFKWLWNRALERETEGDHFLFAYEDAIGFCPTRRVRDKDGIATAVVVTEMARAAKTAGTTLYAQLQAIYQRHGLSVNRQVSIKLSGDDARDRMNERLQALRQTPPIEVAGLAVTRIHDYQTAQRHAPDGSDAEPIPLPATDLVQLDLAGREGTYHVSIRPSGTEPKLKIYLEYLGAPASADLAGESQEADGQLERIGQDLERKLTNE
ncbi:phospho-sugar mutase [Spiribacter vilamensis]|uniref:Phosphomannomutase n=1 Tax=Spiribacter vilamensis TaxID=531306 RepID=A0A4Q8D2J7_9GAMM|nr:phospho-sugar mutase [Spiribacter vilamensis]RZU99583.1 phosphomannomutase [Spiribacter vilamensis]TVO61450.1 phospho-sugar mutase [Spiribacter vilamensis]